MISSNTKRMDTADIAGILERLHKLPPTALFNSDEASIYLNTRSDLMRMWRWRGCGPRFVGNGHLVRYRKRDLDSYLIEGGAPDLPAPEAA